MRQLAGTKTRYRRAHAAPLAGLVPGRSEHQSRDVIRAGTHLAEELTMARLVVGNLHCNYERECHLGSIIRLPLYVHADSPFWNLTARQEVLFSSHEKAQKTQRITHFMDRVLLTLCFLCCFVARKKS